MIGTTNTSARRLAVVTLVAAAVAALASPAFARPTSARPDDRAGALGPGTAIPNASAHAVRPDDRAGFRGIVTQSRVLRILHPHASTAGSFDWNDALIGAGVASAAALLMFGAFAVRRHVRLAPAAAVPNERSL